MNFTVVALITATLIIVAVLPYSYTGYMELSYTPIEKLEALDRLAAAQALVAAQRGGNPYTLLSEIARLYGWRSYSVERLRVEPHEKEIVLRVDHGFLNVTVHVYLRLEVVGVRSVETPAGNTTLYNIRVWSDEPQPLTVRAWWTLNGYAEASTPGPVCDSRGICVTP